MDKSRAIKTGALGGTIIAAAMLIAAPFIGDHEGDKLDSYEDVAGVWTICEGVTGPDIKPGLKMTAEQCDSLNQSEIGQFMTKVADRITVPVSAETLAAHTSFAYNIGIAGYTGSKALKETNAGKISKGCKDMANWYTAGGMDCRNKANNCYGLIERRNDEIKLCLVGTKKGE